MLPSTTHMHLSLGFLAMTITACAGQPSAAPPAEAPELASPTTYFESDLVKSPGLASEAEKTLVLQIGSAAPDVVPVRYERGVEETVRWEGGGQGVAELKNEHGQLIWRVSEGGEAFSGTIPAGLYTLTVRGGEVAASRTLVVEPAIEGMRQRRDIFWPEGTGAERGPADRPLFRYKEFKDQDYSGRSLAKAHFFEARVERMSFVGADLRNATLERTEFKDCNFDGAILSSSFIRESSLSGCSFEGARLEDSFVRDTNIRQTSFRRADLKRASFDSVRLVDVDLSDADRRGVKVRAIQPPDMAPTLAGPIHLDFF